MLCPEGALRKKELPNFEEFIFVILRWNALLAYVGEKSTHLNKDEFMILI